MQGAKRLISPLLAQPILMGATTIRMPPKRVATPMTADLEPLRRSRQTQLGATTRRKAWELIRIHPDFTAIKINKNLAAILLGTHATSPGMLELLQVKICALLKSNN